MPEENDLEGPQDQAADRKSKVMGDPRFGRTRMRAT